MYVFWFFFFFKQKTAYEMRISDWSSDVCSSDLSVRAEAGFEPDLMQGLIDGRIDIGVMYTPQRRPNLQMTALMDERLVLVESTASGSSAEIGSASCRERGCQSV